MKRLALALFALVPLFLAACGTAAPPAADRSELEARQTAVALSGQPTLVPLPPGPTSTPAPDVATLLAIADDDPRALGRPDAPVLIVEFTDFEWPFCQQFVRETRPQIIAQFVETGQARFVVRDFPLTDIHPSAMLAAVASRCAAQKGQFWPMSERLFASHRTEWGGVPNRDRVVFIDFATELGLDRNAFATCLDDPVNTQAVRDEMQLAASLGINSTPNFLVNGQLLRGALPLRTFENLIVDASQ